MNEIENSNLYAKILDKCNIYNAIYSMESYITEKGLLSESDIQLYYELSDKYNKEQLDKVIDQCKNTLGEMLLSKDKLFEIEVFFKIKSYSDGEVKFRPMHTASLIDQICMVCMLQPLVFDDSSDARNLSDLSSLIPSNFYGNMPSTTVDSLFIRWQKKYKEYSEAVIEHYNEYKENKKYSHEVCLDLKDFFPSIKPEYLFDYIFNKLSTVWFEENEQECLKVVLTKLLYFNIKNENGSFAIWDSVYYPDKKTDCEKDAIRMNRGLPQGLPHAYFFGNLCMIEVEKAIRSIFGGEGFYYIDDSVIYTNIADGRFPKMLEKLNKQLAEIGKNPTEHSLLTDEQQSFQKNITYKITVHEAGKSTCARLEKSHINFGGLQNLARQTSLCPSLLDSFDEVGDELSKNKIEALLTAIDNELDRIKGLSIDNKEVKESNLKLLKRYRRFFLYRQRLAAIREKGNISLVMIESFINRFQLNQGDIDLEKLFETWDEDIFLNESRLLMSAQDNNNLPEKIKKFEIYIAKKQFNVSDLPENHLFHTKDINGSNILTEYKLVDNQYKTLIDDFNKKYQKLLNPPEQVEIDEIKGILDNPFADYSKEYFGSVYKASNEFKRKILNAAISRICLISISDNQSFYKWNNRSIQYYEFRIIAYLRNRFNFKFDEFILDAKAILNDHENDKGSKTADPLLFEVMHYFIVRVRQPKLIDNLIQIHRLVNGLWKNGSKFLNAFTLHNQEHAVNLIQNCIRILQAVDYLNIKAIDYYIVVP